MKKRALTGICIAAMLMALVGCGGKEPEKVVTDDLTETIEKAADEKQEEPEAEEEKEETEEPEEEEEASEEEAEADVEFSLGEIKDNVYENEYLGIKFTPLEGMEFASEDRLAQLSATTADLLKDEEAVKKQLDKGGVIISCYAGTDETKLPMSTFNITMQEMNSLQLKSVSEEVVIDQAISMIQSVFEQNGFTNIQISKDKMTFLGEEHTVMYLTAEKEGFGTIYEREAVIIKDGCVASYTASTIGTDGDGSKEILDQVTKY